MAKKAKKRGVKPGTKRGPYRKNARLRKIALDSAQYSKLFKTPSDAKIGDTFRIKLPDDFKITDTPIPMSVGNLPSLMTELQATISQLEGQLTAQIDRIKSILM